jgi:cytochrome c peroxidase
MKGLRLWLIPLSITSVKSIAAYEGSSEVNPFSSKYDYYLKEEAKLTEQEAWGL